jgi:hypothetical protein
VKRKRQTEMADSYPRNDSAGILHGERSLEQAEGTLEIWAHTLAAAGRDSDAAEALRVASTILNFRCGFLGKDKAP